MHILVLGKTLISGKSDKELKGCLYSEFKNISYNLIGLSKNCLFGLRLVHTKSITFKQNTLT